MSNIVLDASVVLAILRNETYEAGLVNAVEGAVMSAVNLCEVWTKVHEYSLKSIPHLETVLSLLDRIEPFTATHARIAADLRPRTRSIGLSFGDRACLALGIALNADVYTAEHKWTEVSLPCRIHLIRERAPKLRTIDAS